ncbi:serine/threonine-protein phosphatase Pgam5, mitochondrial isoform X2 [Culicoides brevitarsis]|uniref:serine/threonine-protein phosphatase Pgam5, mitochondrial isoform X2 n=1 Tax=Culicoides brevitarsis TaxID=469753 RepID=UPI00307BF4BF
MSFAWTKAQKLATIATGVFSGFATYYIVDQRQIRAHASWTTNWKPSDCGKWDDNWDHRDPKSLVKPLKENADAEAQKHYEEKLAKLKPKAVRHIIMIRHGQYYLNGKTDAERVLSPMGKEQATFTGARLNSLTIPWDSMIMSTMTRAQQTGELIAKELGQNIPIEHCSLIEEGAPIPPEPAVGHWRPEPQFFQDGARIEAAFRKYFHRAEPEQQVDSYTLMVCHANVIRYFVCRALQFPPEAWLRLSLNHASITWVSITATGRVILRTFGDSGHIPPAFVSSSNVNK